MLGTDRGEAMNVKAGLIRLWLVSTVLWAMVVLASFFDLPNTPNLFGIKLRPDCRTDVGPCGGATGIQCAP